MDIVPQSGSYAQLPLFPEVPTKVCSTCGAEYPATMEYWHKQKNGKYGLKASCKICRNREHRLWQQANREKVREIDRRWRSANLPKKREQSLRWKRANRARMVAYSRQWAKSNPEKISARSRRRKARKKGAIGSHTAAEVQLLYEKQCGKCYHCGTEFNGVYTEDHVIPLARGGSDYIENIVLMCRSCNSSKGAKLLHEWDSRYNEK